MRQGWLKLSDRLVRLDRVHEFWIERTESGYVVKAAVFGTQDLVLEYFSTYDEAEEFLERIYLSLSQETPMIDVSAIKEGWSEDFDDMDDLDDDDLPF